MNNYLKYPYSGRRSPHRQPSVKISRKRTDVEKSDYLVHFGIRGQKWGVRRFQNEDGTLTEEGKKRYGSDTIPESETWKKSDVESLSDEELNRRNSRLQRERQYKDLTTSEVEREWSQRKKEVINKVLVGTAVSLVAVAMRGKWQKAGSFITKYGKRAIGRIKTGSISRKAMTNAYAKYGGNGLSKAGRSFKYLPKVKRGLPMNDMDWPAIPKKVLTGRK